VALWVLAAIGGFFMMDYMWQTFFEKDYIKYKKRREKKLTIKKLMMKRLIIKNIFVKKWTSTLN